MYAELKMIKGEKYVYNRFTFDKENNEIIKIASKGFEKVSFETYMNLKKKYEDKAASSVCDYDSIILPKRATKKSAGYDFFNPFLSNIVIKPGETIKIPTFIKVSMFENFVLNLYTRSSMGIDKNLCLANGTGIIDADYYNNPKNEGCIIVALRNDGDEYTEIECTDRICQGVFVSIGFTNNDYVDTIRSGGIGSTGK